MKKRRVRLFVDGEALVHSHFSGIGHYTANLLRAIDELLYNDAYAHFSVSVGVPSKQRHKLAIYGFENIAFKSIPLPGWVINGLKQRHRLPPIELLFGNQVYLFPNYSTWPTMLGKSIPIIYDLSFVNHAEFVEPRNQAFLVDQVQLSAKRAKQIVTISQNSKQEIVDHYKFSAKNVPIVYPAVDQHKFYRRSQTEINYVKAKYGIFDNYVLFVGNIEPRKNLITLLKAYKQLPKYLQGNYALLMVGAKGWLDNEIKDTILGMRLEGLHVLQPSNYVVDEDLPALYSGASAFVYVSRYEGFGIPPIEAMACGTPTITSNNSSLPEVVGKASLQVDALDDQQLTESIERLLTDPELCTKLVSEGYRQIMKFNWIESAKVLLQAAEEIQG